MSNSNNDELARIVTPAVFQYVRREDMFNSDDRDRLIHEGNLTRYEYPRGYVIRSRADLENIYAGATVMGCAFVFYHAKGLYPRIVWRECKALGIPACLLDEDRVVINSTASTVNVLHFPPHSFTRDELAAHVKANT